MTWYRPGWSTTPSCDLCSIADLGTDPKGAVRFSIGYCNTVQDIDRALEVMEAISTRR